jgi:hypothetical protein
MSDNIRIPDSTDMRRLAAMRLVAQMKESADRNGVGFIGGNKAPDGQKFVMTNMEDEDMQCMLPEELQ